MSLRWHFRAFSLIGASDSCRAEIIYLIRGAKSWRLSSQNENGNHYSARDDSADDREKGY